MTAPFPPPGAVDTHIHILRPDRYPYPSPTATPPPVCTVASYRDLQRRLGLSRVVVVTPSNYATDNRCTLAALAEFGTDVARGVGVAAAGISDAELDDLDAGGVRGLRFNATRPGGTDLDDLPALAARVADRGWHVQLHCAPELLVAQCARLADLPSPLVIDHLGRIPARDFAASPAFDAACRLLDTGRAWIKIGGGYHVSQDGPPFYPDAERLAREFLIRYPDRCLWATDWPHTPSLRGDLPMPDDAVLLARVAGWGNTDTLTKLFVTNPERLYGFDAWIPDSPPTHRSESPPLPPERADSVAHRPSGPSSHAAPPLLVLGGQVPSRLPARPETKSDYAYRVLREQILDGTFASGATVPLREVAADYGMSTTPLREALRRLDAEGLVTLDNHKNARVAELRADEARDLLEMRRSLDPLAAGLAAERRSSEELRAIRAAAEHLAPLPVEATLEQLIAHRELHTAIYRASHNELLIATLDTLWDKADRYRMLALKEDRGDAARELKRQEHDRMVELIAARDASGVADLMLRHIDTSLAVTALDRLSMPSQSAGGDRVSA